MSQKKKQIKKNKEKIRERRGSRGAVKASPMVGFADTLAEEDAEGEIVVTTIDYKPMDAEEAVMQLDLIDDSFLVFTNAKTDEVNVVYRRDDGNIGWIDPK